MNWWQRIVQNARHRQSIMETVAKAARGPELGWALVGRFTTLPLTGTVGQDIIQRNVKRMGLRFFNAGIGTVYLSLHGGVLTANNGIPLGSLGAHYDELGATARWVAVGDAGHDLYVAEKLV